MISLVLIAEDSLSGVVAKKIIAEANKNYEVVNVIFWNKNKIKKRIKKINKAAKGYVYFVLTDQDTADRCPPNAINELPGPLHPNLMYRFAVMEIESWVMAHRDAISDFLLVPKNRIPDNTDTIDKPKEYLINLARKSRSGRIKKDIVPRDKSTSQVGPDYNGRLGEFVSKHWDVRIASQHSPSLTRTFRKLQSFAQTPFTSVP